MLNSTSMVLLHPPAITMQIAHFRRHTIHAICHASFSSTTNSRHSFHTIDSLAALNVNRSMLFLPSACCIYALSNLGNYSLGLKMVASGHLEWAFEEYDCVLLFQDERVSSPSIASSRERFERSRIARTPASLSFWSFEGSCFRTRCAART